MNLKGDTKKFKKAVEDSKQPTGDVEIIPLKDFRITHNQYDIFITEGEPVTIPRLFLQNMVTEGVIKSF